MQGSVFCHMISNVIWISTHKLTKRDINFFILTTMCIISGNTNAYLKCVSLLTSTLSVGHWSNSYEKSKGPRCKQVIIKFTPRQMIFHYSYLQNSFFLSWHVWIQTWKVSSCAVKFPGIGMLAVQRFACPVHLLFGRSPFVLKSLGWGRTAILKSFGVGHSDARARWTKVF